jgi:large subunit ribosomal protein L16
LRAFPDTPITSKPSGTRMGKGKGALSHWVAVLKPGQIIFEILGVPQETALRALESASKKIPLRTGPAIRIKALNPDLV